MLSFQLVNRVFKRRPIGDSRDADCPLLPIETASAAVIVLSYRGPAVGTWKNYTASNVRQ